MDKINLRKAVSVVVFKNDQFLMVSGKDWPPGAWCFPQGGVKENETHLQAVKRELEEELGTNKFLVLSKSQTEHSYLFPEKIKQKKGYDGQFQTIWFVEFLGDFNEIKPNSEELMQQSWFNENEIIPSMMYPEQKETFEKVLKELNELKQKNIF